MQKAAKTHLDRFRRKNRPVRPHVFKRAERCSPSRLATVKTVAPRASPPATPLDALRAFAERHVPLALARWRTVNAARVADGKAPLAPLIWRADAENDANAHRTEPIGDGYTWIALDDTRRALPCPALTALWRERGGTPHMLVHLVQAHIAFFVPADVHVVLHADHVVFSDHSPAHFH